MSNGPMNPATSGGKEPLRVLHLEDDPNDARLLWGMLGGLEVPCRVTHVGNGPAFKKALSAEDYDLIISDFTLPSFGGTAALEAAKESRPDVPFIYFSDTMGEDAAVRALQAGATDYVLKSNSKRLLPAVRRALKEAALARERRLLERKFLQAQKMEAVEKLAGGMAHDFNNILMAIMGSCEFALQVLPEGHEARPDVSDVVSCVERAAALTRRLLAFSRRQILDAHVLDLSAMLSGIEMLLRRLIGEDIDLVILPGEGTGRIKADPNQVEQAIVSLVVNARDAMPRGGRLTLQTAGVELEDGQLDPLFDAKPGAYARLSVRDTGCGMDPAQLDRLYEPFFITKEQGKGTGLGLSMVYGIVKQSGGFIKVASAPGRGTTFELHFPRTEEAVAAPRALAPASRDAGGSETVLLVEDDEDLRALILRALTEQGYRVLAAEDEKDALRICREHSGPVHMLLTDLVMPKMSGGELARRARSLRPEARVLYLSGYAGTTATEKGALEPGADFLQKPFSLQGLALRIRQILERPQRRPGTAGGS